MFEYLNGFRKAIYWSKEKMLTHADTYSQAFSADAYRKLLAGEIPDKDLWKYSSFWYKNFDDMAKKTMLRQLISHWGIMSTELQQAFNTDSTLVEMNGAHNFVATPPEPQPPDEQPTEPEPAPYDGPLPGHDAPPADQTEQINIADL